MLIAKISAFSGKRHVRDIPVTQEQLDDWQTRTLIQIAMPNVSAEDREFLKTGITPEEWTQMFEEPFEDAFGNEEPG